MKKQTINMNSGVSAGEMKKLIKVLKEQNSILRDHTSVMAKTNLELERQSGYTYDGSLMAYIGNSNYSH